LRTAKKEQGLDFTSVQWISVVEGAWTSAAWTAANSIQ
jgi:hypothetical protein